MDMDYLRDMPYVDDVDSKRFSLGLRCAEQSSEVCLAALQ